MASGKSMLTYTGPDDSATLESTVFLKDEPQLINDNGIIAKAQDRDDFTVGPVVEDAAPDEAASVEPEAEPAPAAPDKPKRVRKAKAKAG